MTGHCRLATAALTAAVFLAAPAPGLAQGKPRAPAASLAPPTTSSKVTAPARPEPPPATPPPVETGAWRLAVTLGWEKGGEAHLSGPRVGLELEEDLVALGTRGQLSFVTPVGWFHASDSTSVSAAGATITSRTTFDLFEVIPSFRASWVVGPNLRIFGDLGVGGAWGRTRLDTSSTLTSVAVSTSDGAFAGVVRLAAGASYQLDGRFRIGLEIPTIHRRYGESTSQTFAFSALAAYAF